MPQRQSARKTEKPAARHLRVVPSPKPKRKSRRKFKWPWRTFRPRYETNKALLAYEEEFVLAVIADHGGSASVNGLASEDPVRWDKRYLNRVFKRLHDQRRVERFGRSRRVYNTTYHLPRRDDDA